MPGKYETCIICKGELAPYSYEKIGQYWDHWIANKQDKIRDLRHIEELNRKAKN
jgi:hypothetical protein